MLEVNSLAAVGCGVGSVTVVIISLYIITVQESLKTCVVAESF